MGDTGYYDPGVIYTSDPTYYIQPPSFKNQQITIINNRNGSNPGYYQSPKDPPCDNYVNALDTSGNKIYVGGDFTSPTNHIMGVNINDNTQFSLASGLDASVHAVYYDKLSNRLYAGGEFKYDGVGMLMYNISYFNFSLNTWIQMGINNGLTPGLNSSVNVITSIGTDEYIGGSFKQDSNNIELNRITRYDSITDTFYPLQGLTYGVKNIVYCVVYDNSQYYYVGGNFQNAGGVQANNIARYDIVNEIWESLIDTTTSKNGVDGIVYTILFDSNIIYAGGSFSKVSGKTYNNIAYWDTNSWNFVGHNDGNNGTDGPVFTITKDYNNSYLYIGGKFNYTDYNGSSPSQNNLFNNLAYWGGGVWNYVGSTSTQNGTNDTVRTLFFDGSRLYVGGDFTKVNYNLNSYTDANYIAMWNGGWNPIGNNGNGTNSSVNTITGNNSGTIYIGGKFTIVDYGVGANNTSANHIVIWDGSSWIPLQDSGNSNNGLNGVVNTLYYNTNNNLLYIGGLFSYAYLDLTTTKGPYYNSVTWDGNKWNFIGVNEQFNGVNGEVFSIFYNINYNYTSIAGTFNLAGYDGTNSMNKIQNITYFDGGNWNPLNYNNYRPGVREKEVFALAVIGDDIYVGGSFNYTGPTFDGRTICNYIARWSTIHEVWYPLNYYNGSNYEIGLSDSVRALSTNGTLLFVGGDFNFTNGSSLELNHIAIWDPTLETWTQIISNDLVFIGLDGPVLGLSCKFPYQTLYLSGNFTGIPYTSFQLSQIASFDLNNIGTNNGFQQIIDSYGNTGTNGQTNTILYVYPRLYFGGNFTNVSSGNIPMNYLGYYLYIYISSEVVLYIQEPARQFLDTQAGIISSTYTLTNRFKSVILINCEEDSLLSKYWLIMYRS